MRKNNAFLEEIVRLEILYRYIICRTWYLVGCNNFYLFLLLFSSGLKLLPEIRVQLLEKERGSSQIGLLFKFKKEKHVDSILTEHAALSQAFGRMCQRFQTYLISP